MTVGLLLCGGCGQSGCVHEPATERATIAERFPLTIGEREISVRVALTNSEQAKGLMYCKSLPEDEGMLFVFAEPQKMSFWMNHVPIPLAAGFLRSDGTLDEVREMYANDTRTVWSSGDKIRFVLEVNGGWYARHHIAPGQKLNLSQVAEALRARGAEPSDYGL